MGTMWSQRERDTGWDWVYYLVLVVIIGIASCLALLLVINPSSKSWFNTDRSFEITTQFVCCHYWRCRCRRLSRHGGPKGQRHPRHHQRHLKPPVAYSRRINGSGQSGSPACRMRLRKRPQDRWISRSSYKAHFSNSDFFLHPNPWTGCLERRHAQPSPHGKARQGAQRLDCWKLRCTSPPPADARH